MRACLLMTLGVVLLARVAATACGNAHDQSALCRESGRSLADVHAVCFHGELAILRTSGRLAAEDANAGGIGGLAMVADYASTVGRYFTCYDGDGNIKTCRSGSMMQFIRCIEENMMVREDHGMRFGEKLVT